MRAFRLELEDLRRPAGAVAADWLRSGLDAVLLCALPLAGGSKRHDSEALHDFRVALRRLRVALSAWQPAFGDSWPGEAVAEFAAISRLAGEARDLEVEILALQQLASSFGEPLSGIAKPLVRKLKHDYRDTRRRLARALRERLPAAGEALLAMPVPASALRHEAGAALKPVLAPLRQRLAEGLAAAADPAAVEPAHQARLVAKRLRYLLDPLATALPQAKSAARGLAALQDALGDLHDAQLLQMLIANVELDSAARAAIEPVLAERLAAAFAVLRRRRGARAERAIFMPLDALLTQLDPPRRLARRPTASTSRSK